MKILVINTVGLHLGYLGCYGNDWIATPNLDALAKNGLRFMVFSFRLHCLSIEAFHFMQNRSLTPSMGWLR